MKKKTPEQKLETQRAWFKKWREENKERILEYTKKYIKHRYNNDPEFHKMCDEASMFWRKHHIDEYREYQKLYQRWYRFDLKYGSEDPEVIRRKKELDDWVENRKK